MKRNLVVFQDGIKACGSACLSSVINYYGGHVPMNQLLELTNTTKDGTNFYNLAKAATEIGLSPKGYKLNSINNINNTQLPFISQVAIDGYNHFVVVYKIHKNIFTIMDPAKGMIKMTSDEFSKIWTSYVLFLTPYKKLPLYYENNFLSEIIKSILKNNKKTIFTLILLTIIVTILTGIYSYHFKIIVDIYLKRDSLDILCITNIFIIIMVIKTVIEYLRNMMLIYLNKKIDLTVIAATIKKIILLPYSYYKNKNTGEIIARINDLFYLKNVITKIIMTIFLDMILSLFVFLILYHINSTMTIILLITIVTYFLIFIVYKKTEENTTKNIQKSNANVNSLLTESIISYETIKGLNIETLFINKINKEYQNMINNNLTLVKINQKENLIINLIEGIIILYINYFGILYVKDMTLSLGSLLTYNTLLFYFLNPIKNTLSFYKDFYYVNNSLKRVNNMLNYKYESLDKANKLVVDGDITVNKLTFGYNSQNIILDNINFIIKKHSKILLLGQTGSGKSTLLKIIYRYYDPKRNSITINAEDILDYSIGDIRSSITYIAQNEFIYTDTIRNNIILNREISKNEFEKVCKTMHIFDIIKNNSLSYDMPLEENGANLSGGERQRIILARAFLKKASIILIDEGLNQIDVDLERKILKNIFKNYQDRTIIVVSHRIDNYELYDQVLKLENNQIVKLDKC